MEIVRQDEARPGLTDLFEADPDALRQESDYQVEAVQAVLDVEDILDGFQIPAGEYRLLVQVLWAVGYLKLNRESAFEYLANPEASRHAYEGRPVLWRRPFRISTEHGRRDLARAVSKLCARRALLCRLERTIWSARSASSTLTPRSLRARARRIQEREKPFSRLIISTPARPCAPPVRGHFDARRVTHPRRREPRPLAASMDAWPRTSSP